MLGVCFVLWNLVTVSVLWVGMRCVIVVFHDHTHLLFGIAVVNLSTALKRSVKYFTGGLKPI